VADGNVTVSNDDRLDISEIMLSRKAFRTDATNLDADPPYLVFEYIPAQGEQVPLRYFFRVARANGDCPARQVGSAKPRSATLSDRSVVPY
jgi:hypothetical protein